MAKCRVKTILFDLDGTLLDTAPDLTHALNQLLVRYGKAPTTSQKVRPAISTGALGIIKVGFDLDHTHPDYPKLRQEFYTEYTKNISKHTELFPGMADVLDTLRENGMPWGVVTNKHFALAETLMADLNLLEECACLVGGDTTARAKPYPDPLEFACKQLNVTPSECVYVGDAPSDIEAAKQANMQSIAAMYGYIADNAKPEQWAADFYIDKPGEILDWVFKRRVA